MSFDKARQHEKDLAEFFHDSDFTFGVFYPRHCLTAGFSTFSAAEHAEMALQPNDFQASESIAVSGRDVIEFERHRTTVLSILMGAVSRFFKTEQSFNDLDLELARHGAGFLIVRCPDENKKNKAWQVIKRENPVDARYYGLGGIEHLAGDANTD